MILKINVDLLFPPSDPQSKRHKTYFFKLLAAANDLITTAKQSTALPIPDDPPDKRCLTEAENLYYFRLSCGHMHEALDALEGCYKRGMLQAYRQSMRKEGKEALKRLIHFMENPAEEDVRTYLYNIRNATFHYTGLEEAQGHIVAGLKANESRYVITDQAIASLINKRISGRSNSQKNISINEITLKVAHIRSDIVMFVDHLSAEFYKIHPNAFNKESHWPPQNEKTR